MENKTCIIFGASGQDGFYLSHLLQQKKIATINVSRSGGNLIGNAGNFYFIENLIKQHKPDYIFHLAANSSTKHNVLFENHEAISTGTLNILESVRLHCPSCKIFLSGSAMQFKNEGLPINEKTAFEAKSPYAVSRIQSVYAARYYKTSFNLKVYIGYFFNHDSPLRTEQHVNQKIVKAAKRFKEQKDFGEKLTLGNIDVQKEFNYAADVVNAVWILVNQENIFEAVIGCGKAYSILQWLEYCFERMNLKWQNFVEIKKDFISEYKVLVSDPAVIFNLGWLPQTDFYQLANLMLDA